MSHKYDYYLTNYQGSTIKNLADYIDFCSVEKNREMDTSPVKLRRDRTTKKYNVHEVREIINYLQDNVESNELCRNLSIKDIPLAYLKFDKFKELGNFYKDVKLCNDLSGILLNEESLQALVSGLIPCSFAINGMIQLNSPYYSADDCDSNIIHNPIIKDKAFKVPMVRGSSWKGVIASAAKKVLEEETGNIVKNIVSYSRLFGSGSDEFRNMLKEAEKSNENNFNEQLKLYVVLNLGKKVKVEDNIIDKFQEEINNQALRVQRGRLIFYPTFFNKFDLEMINPHKKETKAGTNPIYYEVAPKGSTGRFQLVYIPADGISNSKEILERELKCDYELLSKALQMIFLENEERTIKIGAKTKLGWGHVGLSCRNGKDKNKLTFISNNDEIQKEFEDGNIFNFI